MRYSPSGNVQDPQVAAELLQISRVIEALAAGIYTTLYAEPDKPRLGMVVLADGTTWDPLSTTNNEEYFCWYDGSAWRGMNEDAGGNALS